jgi:hypothetical protein
MNNDSLTSEEHLESIQIDLLNREFNRNSPNPAMELAALRDFNAQLLERIGQFRRQNLELSANENDLRTSLAEQQAANVKLKAELTQTLTQVTDEKWASDLEVERLRALYEKTAQEFSDTDRAQKTELDSLRTANTDFQTQIAELTRTRDAQATQLGETGHALLVAQEQMAQLSKEFQTRETQSLGAFESLRAEYTSIDKCYKESTEMIAHLRMQLSSSKVEFEKILTEFQARMQSDFQKQFEIVFAENQKLRGLLQVRDTRTDTDLSKLKIWQDQLSNLDRHLQQVASGLKKDKADLSRLLKQVAQELELSRTHPFQDYLNAADMDLAHLRQQLNAMSELSPARSKLETRVAQATEYRDAVHQLLAKAEQRFEERSQMIQALAKSANTF